MLSSESLLWAANITHFGHTKSIIHDYLRYFPLEHFVVFCLLYGYHVYKYIVLFDSINSGRCTKYSKVSVRNVCKLLVHAINKTLSVYLHGAGVCMHWCMLYLHVYTISVHPNQLNLPMTLRRIRSKATANSNAKPIVATIPIVTPAMPPAPNLAEKSVLLYRGIEIAYI